MTERAAYSSHQRLEEAASDTQEGQSTEGRSAKSSKFRADVQGLRALAVSSILLFHFFPDILPGGFVGVDIFFVISGFVITQTAWSRLSEGRFRLMDFYRQRIRRIFPALLAMLCFVAAAGYVILPPMQLKETARNLASTVALISNYDFYRLDDYFDGPSELRPLLHTWSLSVEEQFYLIYPAFLYAMRWPKGVVPRQLIMALALASSFALAEFLYLRSASFAFYMAPARLGEFLVGAALALEIIPGPTRRLVACLAFFGGGVALIATFFFYAKSTGFPGLAALPPCLGTAAMIWAGRARENPMAPLLTNRLAQVLGDISFSVYLWHWPLLAYARFIHGPDLGDASRFVLLSTSIAAGYLSYLYVERPFLKRGGGNSPVFGAGALGASGLLVISALLFYSQGALWRFPPEIQGIYNAANDYNTARASCHGNGRREIEYEKNCSFGRLESPADTAVWGDSHGAELAVALGQRAGLAGRSVMEISTSACPPVQDFAVKESPSCVMHNAQTLQNLTRDKTIKTVVLAANVLRYDFPANAAALERGYEETVFALAGSGKNITLVQQIPVMQSDPPAEIGRALMAGSDIAGLGSPRASYRDYASGWNDFLQRLSIKYGTRLLSPADVLCGDAACYMYRPGVGVLYFNADHLSVTGAKFLLRSVADSLYGQAP
jgi:peptidoglycan/LPS O-acetylase OafA/YrhL